MINIFKQISEYLRNRRERINAECKARRKKEVCNRFSVEECNNGIFIMCDDKAIRRLDAELTVNDILTSLSECRVAAMAYDRLL